MNSIPGIVLTGGIAVWCLTESTAYAQPTDDSAATAQLENAWADVDRHMDAGKIESAVAAARKAIQLERKTFGDVEISQLGEFAAILEIHATDFNELLGVRKEILSLLKKDSACLAWELREAQSNVSAIEEIVALSPEDNAQFARVWKKQNSLYFKQPNEDLLGIAQDCLLALKNLLGKDHRFTTKSTADLAELTTIVKPESDVCGLFQSVAQRYLRHFGAEHPTYGTAICDLARAYYAQNEFVLARLNCEKAITISRNTIGTTPQLAFQLRVKGDIYYALGNIE